MPLLFLGGIVIRVWGSVLATQPIKVDIINYLHRFVWCYFLLKSFFPFIIFFDLYFCLLFHYLCENKGKQRALIYFLLINQFFFSDLRYSFMFFIAFKVFLLCVFFVKILSLSWHKT